MTDDRRQQELLRLAQEVAQPQLTEPRLRERFGSPENWLLRPGSVWRARWDDTAILVLLVGGPTTTSVTVAPVTFDPEALDEDTLVVNSPSRGGVPMTVWRAMQRDLPLATLDRPLDVLPPAVTSWASGGPVPAGARAGESGLPKGIRSSPVRADMLDDLVALLSAASATVATVPVADSARGRVSPTPDQYKALTDRLGVGLPAVLDLVDGKRLPTVDEADALRDILGLVPDVAQSPPGLLIEMCHPRWKRTVLDLARRDGLDEASARAVMSNGVFGLAARQTGGHAPDWRERLSRWTDAQGLARS